MSKSAPIRVGIVNDLKLATQMLSRIIASDPALVVAWSAVDGEQAISRCVADRPDILLMEKVSISVFMWMRFCFDAFPR